MKSIAGPMSSSMRCFENSKARFVLAGIANNAISYIVYLVLLRVTGYLLAYTLSYAAGIVASFVLNSLYVFRVPLRWRRLVPYPAVYALQYALGALLTWILVETFAAPPQLAPLAAIVALLPVSYILTRKVLTWKTR